MVKNRAFLLFRENFVKETNLYTQRIEGNLINSCNTKMENGEPKAL